MADSMVISTPRPWKNAVGLFRSLKRGPISERDLDHPIPLYDPESPVLENREPVLEEMNEALEMLVEIFPNVEPEVFRRMIPRVSPESRAQIVADHLLSKKRPQQVRARPLSAGLRPGKDNSEERGASKLRTEDKFQAQEYRDAVKTLLGQEFKNLSRSTIRAVLAECNYSYSGARIILQGVSSKSWRFTFTTFWWRRAPAPNANEHPGIIWQPNILVGHGQVPHVKRTGCAQLDRELHHLFVAPVRLHQRQNLLLADYKYASRINEDEAQLSHALFECACCFNDVPFERLTVCDDDCHQLCSDCVQRTVKEALYGQGWSRTVHLPKGTLRCFSAMDTDCSGAIHSALVQQVLCSSDSSTADMWQEFEIRLASEAVLHSQLPMQRCPFCEYVEIAEVPKVRFRSGFAALRRFARRGGATLQLIALTVVLSAILLPLTSLALAISASFLLYFGCDFKAHFRASWTRVFRRRQGLQFRCLRPQCATVSCKRCMKVWREPHICFEDESTSLRTALEASATAAVKRTCPRCFLSFVKSSGCNKLVCNCGYTMCYICREEITAQEGYGHFCQHFRPSGGRCDECERCDLYVEEDEGKVIQAAVEAAEAEWCQKLARDGDDRKASVLVDTITARTPKLAWYGFWLDAVIDILAR